MKNKWTGKPGDPVRRRGFSARINVLAAIKADKEGTLTDADRRTCERMLPGFLAKQRAKGTA
ncbi:MAG: hypothetical protein ABSD56_00135 [Bryobacteraceae bacterium]|jgi:hypothetical protein